jgi:ABC-2 type transport system ATP-binding protein
MGNIIEVNDLVKDFKVIKKEKGLSGALKSLFKSEKKIVRAVDNISFNIEKGETVGYIGPNGAGKSTTIKMMSGILQPTSGNVLINGLNPHKERKKVVLNLGVVFGQRTQLYWDLRLGESFELLKRIYRIPDGLYKKNIGLMNDILNINELIDTPVRQLSLGQRMRGDLAAAILHSPPVLFLDEPTIGLDIDGKYAIRKFIKDINGEYKTTIILTTHDLDDIKELCSRIIVINHGRIVEDGSLDDLIGKIAPIRKLIIDFYDEQKNVSHPKAVVAKREGARVWLEFEKDAITAAELIADISKQYSVRDLSLEEADIEDIIRSVYHSVE